MKNNKNNITLIVIMIVIAAMSRLLPHPPNFSPITAMAMFGGAYLFRKSYALLIPLVMLFVSDLILNNTSIGWIVDPNSFTIFSEYQLWVYLPMLVIVLFGMRMMNKVNLKSVIGYTLLSSIVFFLVSNFGSFLTDPMYTKDFAGLIMSYMNGVPFFRTALLGNLIYAIVMFGTYEWVTNRKFILNLIRA